MWMTSAAGTAGTGVTGILWKVQTDVRITAARIMSRGRRADGARTGKAGDK